MAASKESRPRPNPLQGPFPHAGTVPGPRPGILASLAFLFLSLILWSCHTNDAEDVYTVTLKLDSARVGKFDSVRVEIYNGPAPAPGEAKSPVQVKTLVVTAATKEVTVQLDSKVNKDFSVVVTGFKGDAIAYRNLHTVEGYAAPDSTKPSVLLVTRIQADDMDLAVGETRAPRLTLTPENAGDKRIVLAGKDPSLVKITPGTGKDAADSLTGLKEGRTTVKASTPDGAVSVEFSVSVATVLVASLRADSLSLKVGDSLAPVVTVLPANATDKDYRLASSDSSIVEPAGKSIKAVKAGKAKVILASRDGGAEDTVAVVVRLAVTGLAAKNLVKEAGDSFAPLLDWEPADATDRSYALASGDTDKVAVRGDSLKAKGEGDAVITVTAADGGFTAEFTVSVVKKIVRVQGISAKNLRGLVGDTLDPQLTWNPAEPSDKGFSLRSLDTVKVRIAGEQAVAKALGKAKIEVTAADGGRKDTFELSVEAADFKLDVLPVTSLKCAPCHVPGTNLNFQDSISLVLNGSKALDRLQRAPGDPSKMPVKDAPNGQLTPRQLALLLQWLNARVVPLKSVTVANDSIRVGESQDPPITWDPPKASNKSFTLLSLDTSKVTISGNQVVGKALGQAQVQLRALDGDKLALFTVTVVPTPVDSIHISDTTATVGDTIFVEARFHPSDATNQNYSLTKFRPASAVTAVLPGKRIVAAALGKDTLVATSIDGGKKAQFTVTVGPVLPTALNAPDTNGLALGPLVTPRLIWTPANTTNKAYTLSIAPADTAIAAVATAGTQIQGKTLGIVDVTATSNQVPTVKKVFKFTVGPVNVVSLTAAPVITYPGLTLDPVLTWNPANATTKTYSLFSPDTAKAAIVANRVSVRKLGSITITVTSTDQNKTAPWNLSIIRSPFTPAVLPLVTKNCGSCHNASFAPTNWQDSATAVLNRVEMLRRTALPLDSADHMPPSYAPQPPPAELTIIRAWLSQE